MKVKIGDRIYDPEDEPILVILSDTDKANIANMDKTCTMYCSFPEGSDPDDILKWMLKGERK